MRAALVSDAHAAGPLDQSQRSLVQWLERLEVDHLYLLGDIFHHWWGFEPVMQPYAEVVEALAKVRRRGTGITLVPGNHDFAVGRVLREEVGIEVRAAHTVELAGRRFLLAHGDEADASMGYRLTSAVLRGRAFAGLMQLLGPQRGYQLLARLAGSSRAHGGEPGPLLELQQAWARKRLGVDADVVVMGHIHVPLVVPLPEGTVVHLGDWVEHRTWLRVEDDHFELVQGLDGRPWTPA